MDFEQFKKMQQVNFGAMSDGHNTLFVTDVDKDMLWETFLNSFPQGTNEVYRERREFDCSCCKQFIRAFGNVVFIKDNKLVSIWDFDPDDPTFTPVAKALSALVKSAPVADVFVTKQGAFGTDKSHELMEGGDVHTWFHFRIDLPQRFITTSNKSESTIAASYRDARNVFKRSLDEIDKSAIETVLDLIAEKTLYRGDEWQTSLSQFLALYNEYHSLPEDEQENYCWAKSVELGGAVSKIRNHSIGVLLQDLTTGVELDKAMRKYETIVAPTNYKRPKAIFTAKMVEQAEKTITDMGLLDSLGRRHAQLRDITINNVIWANRDAAKHMDGAGGVFAVLKQEAAVNPKSYDDLPGVGIDAFLEEILPNTTTLEVLLENRHQPNLVSLVAPQVMDSLTLFKWGNAFSWAYNGNIADSMKQRVKAAGGNVEGVLRFSIQWNDDGNNNNDFDAHCIEPKGFHINYAAMHNRQTTGVLDVDIRYPVTQMVNRAAVENITWTSLAKMHEGFYEFYVHNYAHRGGRSGFDAEIEYDGQIYEFTYHKELAQGEKVIVAKVNFDKRNGLTFLSSLPTTTSSKTIWGLQTNQFHPASVFMHSPNYWDGQNGIGHKHHFFMLAGCQNEDRPNGFFNEYLREDFMEHKRVFEALGSKMRVENTEDQLSGLGFSSTKRNSLICKVDGRMVKIIF